jgi:O-methyltransferase
MQKGQTTSTGTPRADRSESDERRAAGPGAEREELREAYLSLLALALCDLVGTGTTSVFRRLGGGVFARELMDEEMAMRVSGRDWPLHGLSMAGMHRLRDARACIESVVTDGVPGDVIEIGCWRGGASILMRATLDTLGDDRTVWLADSFAGFPLPDPERYPQDRELEDLSLFDFLAAPLEDVRENFERLGLSEGIRFLPGFFDQTLPGLRDGHWSLVRLDGDTYESTRLALESLYAGLSAGGYLIIDDYWLIEECQRAVADFRAENRIEEPIERIDWSGARWRRESEQPVRTGPVPPQARRDRTAARLPHKRVPGLREIELEYEAGVLRDRLRKARAEIDALRAGEEPPEPSPTTIDPPEPG